MLACCALSLAAAGGNFSATSSNDKLLPELKVSENNGIALCKVTPLDESGYQGVIVNKIIDLTGSAGDNKIRFQLKTTGRRFDFIIRLGLLDGGYLYRSFANRTADEMNEIVLDLDRKNWTWDKPEREFGLISSTAIYAKEFKKPYIMEISEPEFELPQGNQVISAQPGKDAPVFTADHIPADWQDIGAPWKRGGPELMNGRIDIEASWNELENQYSGIECRFRQTGNNPYSAYWVYFRPMHRSISVEKMIDNKLDTAFRKQIRYLAAPPAWKPGQTYKLQVEFTGNVIKAWVDGVLCLYAADGHQPFDRGDNAISLSHDGKIHKLNIHRDEQTKVLEIASIRYLTPPEHGAVNAGTEQAYWGLKAEGEPGIIFDLGKKYYVRKIHIEADAIPTQNFSSAVISVSNNGRDWQTVSAVANNRAERTRQKYELQGDVDAVGQYFRLVFARSKFDNAVEISNIRFLGNDSVASLQTAGRNKRKIQRPAGMPLPSFAEDDKENLYLQHGQLEAAIAGRNGAVSGIRNAGKPQVAAACDTYFLENRQGVVQVSELDDRVTGFTRENGGLVIRAANAKMPGIDIIKQYSISEDGKRLRKRIAFVNARTGGGNDLFLTLCSHTFLDSAYREDGVYFGADWGLGGRTPAEEVVFDMANMPHAAGNSKIGFFINTRYPENIGQYLLKVNDRMVSGTITLWYEKENIPFTYTPDGWKAGMATLQLLPGQETSLEYQYMGFAGSDLNFYQSYRNIPEIAARYDEFAGAPAWLRDLKCGIPGNLFNEVVAGLDMFNRDGYVTALNNGPNLWGDWIGRGTGVSSYGDLVPCELVAEEFTRLRQHYPFGLAGIYNWAWCGMPDSRAYRKHPEWFIRKDKNGRFWSAYGSGTSPNYLRHAGDSASAGALLDGAAEIMENIGCDFFYLDGGCGGTNVIDWENLRVSQIYDWDDFHSELKKKVRAFGEDKAMFFNSRSEWVYDIGIHEGVQSRFTRDLWRDSADALYALKIRQKSDPLRKVHPMYWLDNIAQYYANYCIGMGFPPYVWSGIIPRTAYISAAYENRNLELLDGKYTPDWRANTDTSTEMYTFKNGTGRVLSVIDHNRLAVPVEVEVCRKSIELDTGGDLFAWRFTLLDIAPRLKSEYGIPEWMAAEIYQKTGFGCDIIARGRFHGVAPGGETYRDTFDFKPEFLEYLVLSTGPAAIYSINGQRTNFWQPDSGRVSLKSTLSDRKIEISQQGSDRVESIVYIPLPWQGLKVKGAVLKTNFFMDRQQYAILSMNPGQDAVIEPERILEKRDFADAGPLRVRHHGDTLEITVPGDHATLRIMSPDNVLVYVNHFKDRRNIELPLPAQLAAGEYRVIADAAAPDGSIRSAGGSFVLSNQYRYYPPAEKWIRGRVREVKPPVISVKPVNKTVNGLKLLHTGIDSHDNYDGAAYVKIDPDKLAVTVGGLDYPASWAGARDYAFAGFEFEELRVVTVRVASNMKDIHGETAAQANFPYTGADSFGGLMVDYHTPQGYARRVGLSLGQINTGRTLERPGFGYGKAPVQYAVIDNLIGAGNNAEYTLDLSQWAPAGWDGRVWLILGADGAGPQRRLSLEVAGHAARPAAGLTPVKSLNVKPGDISVPFLETPVTVDGRVSGEEWRKAAKINELHVLQTLDRPAQATELLLGMDAEYLYLGARLHEDSRPFLAESRNLWENDGLDISFGVSGGIQHQIIVDCAGNVFQLDTRDGKTLHVEQTPWSVAAKTSVAGKTCEMEIAVKRGPALKAAGGKVKFNVARYRAMPGAQSEIYSVTPLEKATLMEPELFNTLTW